MPCEDFRLKIATTEDWEKIYRFYSSLDQEDLYYRFFHMYVISQEDARVLARGGDHVTVLAMCGEEVVGEGTVYEDGEIALIVDKSYRNRGIGKRIIEDLIKIGREKGFERLTFYALRDNTAMIKLGEIANFVIRYKGEIVVGERVLTETPLKTQHLERAN
jgi:GNAT superfamily N-acetyltransferase